MTASGPSRIWLSTDPLVLASGSATRARLLADIGIPFETCPPDVDERALSRPLEDSRAGALAIAEALADAKTLEVASRRPGRLVLGSDQTLAIGTQVLSKPQGRAGAKAHLSLLSGRSHQLHSAATLAQDGRILGRASDSATLVMRILSDSFIEAYLDQAGDGILGSVGAYQVEGLGLHLFEKIEGQHATILGLPLLDLLPVMRALDLLRT